MKLALILLAALGLAFLSGILISRPRPDVRPGVSVLPEFDSAEFMPILEGACSAVKLEGAEAQDVAVVLLRGVVELTRGHVATELVDPCPQRVVVVRWRVERHIRILYTNDSCESRPLRSRAPAWVPGASDGGMAGEPLTRLSGRP